MVRNGLLNRLQEQLRRLARSQPIVSTRGSSPTIVAQAIGARTRGDWRQDPAARTFQALRIAVNRELHEVAHRAAAADRALLAPGGRLAVDQLPFARGSDRQALLRVRVAARSAAIARLARMPIREAALPPAPLAIVGRAIKPRRAEIARESARAQRGAARRPSARAHALPRRLAARRSGEAAMTRVNVLLLCVLVGCALSLVTSRHQARSLTVELEREQARARQFDVEYGQLSARAVDVGHAGARREDRARVAAHATARVVARRGRRSARRTQAKSGAPRREATSRRPRRAAAACARRCCCSAASRLLFIVLLGRSLYLQWMDNEFLQEQGARAFRARSRCPRIAAASSTATASARDLDAGEIAVGVSATRSTRRPSSCASSRACSRRRRSS